MLVLVAEEEYTAGKNVIRQERHRTLTPRNLVIIFMVSTNHIHICLVKSIEHILSRY